MPQEFKVRQNRRSKARYEQHMYYRRPNRGEQRNWLVVGGVMGDKRQHFEDWRGFTALREFGTLPGGHTNPWEHILTHPDGPAAFPADQILTLRWYDMENIPTRCDYEPEPEVPCPIMLRLLDMVQNGTLRFPQLAGHNVVELSCPDCDRPPFPVIDGMGGVSALARHLSIMHGWDSNRIKSYGDRRGIDFDSAFEYERKSKTFTFGEEPAVHGDFSCECGWTPDPDKKGTPANQLRGHQMGAHKKEKVPA